MLKKDGFIQKLARFAGGLRCVTQNGVFRKLVVAYHFGYGLCYVVGAQAMRTASRLGRRLKHLLVPAGRMIYRAADFLILTHIRSLSHKVANEAVHIIKDFPVAVRRLKEAFAHRPSTGFKMLLLLPVTAVRRHRRAVVTMVNLIAPVAAVAGLVFTINFWGGMTFALAVEYNGQTLGYISDEAVYDNAANMATDRVINTDNSFEVKRVPKMTIAVVSKSQILDEGEVCDKILKSSGDAITEACGLYIDDKFEGAAQSRSELDALLNALLNQYSSGGANERAEFVQKVDVVEGLYPASSIDSLDKIRDRMTSLSMVDKYYEIVKGDSPLLITAKTDMSLDQLRAMNPGFDNNIFPNVKVLIQKAQPYLRVQVVRTIEYDEAIAFKTTNVQDTKEYIGFTKIRTDGVEGTQHIKAEVTLLDGIEQSRKILETNVTKAPVDKVVVVGAKKINNSVSVAGDGISTGRFIWPLPSCRTISSPFGYRRGRFHEGIDISGNGVYGQSVVSADGGTVAEVNFGWGGGYGKYVIIDHGGGYRTVYAHLSAINVAAGQKVSQGQMIGKAGNSGNSSGAHLHFEVRINGKITNPVNYFK